MRTLFSRLAYLPLFGILTLTAGCQPSASSSDATTTTTTTAPASAPTGEPTMTTDVKQDIQRAAGTLDQGVHQTAATVMQDVKQALPVDPPQQPAPLPSSGALKSDLDQAATAVDQTSAQVGDKVKQGVSQGVQQFDQKIRSRAHQMTDQVIKKGEDEVRQDIQRAEDQLKKQFGNPR